MVKEVPGERALMRYCAASLAEALLHVTPSFVPRLSSKTGTIWLPAVTALVSTTTVVALEAMATLPAAEEPQTAGEALELQFVSVSIALNACGCTHMFGRSKIGEDSFPSRFPPTQFEMEGLAVLE